MKLKLLTSALALSLGLTAATTNASVLTFDDIPGATLNHYGAIGTYAGFDFGATNGYNRLDWVDGSDPSWTVFGSVSGAFSMLNNYGGIGIIKMTSGADFTYDGMWAKGDVTVTGLKNGVELWYSNVSGGDWTYSTGQAWFYSIKQDGDTIIDITVWDITVPIPVDELRIEGFTVVDNLALSPVAAVPVPATAWLLGSGLLGLVGVARRKAA